VSANAAGAVQIDGATAGVAPWEGTVSPGAHVVRVTAAGMVPYSSEVVVRDGETRSLDVTLRAEGGGVSAVWWIAGGIVAAAGLGVGGYFLFRPSQSTTGPATDGTISPYTLVISR